MYWCEITMHAGTYSCLLRGASAGTPRLAVRWLQTQADRLADLMDPQPWSMWVPMSPQGTTPLREVEADDRDVPEELRAWSNNHRAHEYAMGALSAGAHFRFVTGDSGTEIVLSARLVTARAPGASQRPVREFTAA